MKLNHIFLIKICLLTNILFLTSCSKKNSASNASNNIKKDTKNQFMYIANRDTNTIHKCNINLENGNLENCSNANVPINYTKESTALAVKNNFLYITGIYKNIYKCEINNTNGDLLNCGETGADTNDYITSIEIFQNNAVIIDSRSFDVFICPLNKANLNLEKCNFFSKLQSIDDLALKGNFAYFTLPLKNDIVKCAIDINNNRLENCKNAALIPNPFAQPDKIHIYNNFLYVSNRENNTITKCDIDPATGEFELCAPVIIPRGLLQAPSVISAFNDNFYVTNLFNHSLTQCKIKPTDGYLKDCKQYNLIPNPFYSPRGMAITSF